MNAGLIAEFTVLGEAKTAGSKKGFVNKRTGRVIITDDTDAAGKNWRAAVQEAAEPHFVNPDTGDPIPLSGPVELEILFNRPRPKGHFGSGRNERVVKDSSPAYPQTRPDIDKLSRAILDALKGIVYEDDGQVVTKVVRKRYSVTGESTTIKVFRPAVQVAADLPQEQRIKPDVWGERADPQTNLLAAA